MELKAELSCMFKLPECHPTLLLVSFLHQIPEWLSLEGTTADHLLQHPCSIRATQRKETNMRALAPSNQRSGLDFCCISFLKDSCSPGSFVPYYKPIYMSLWSSSPEEHSNRSMVNHLPIALQKHFLLKLDARKVLHPSNGLTLSTSHSAHTHLYNH